MNLNQIKQEAREDSLYEGTDLFSFRGKQLDSLLERVAGELEKVLVLEKRDELLDGSREQFVRRGMSVGWNDYRAAVQEAFTRFKGESV